MLGARWLTPVILAIQESRDQEDRSSKPAQANSSRDPMEKGMVEWLKQ
jgi:hypothetical protein